MKFFCRIYFALVCGAVAGCGGSAAGATLYRAELINPLGFSSVFVAGVQSSKMVGNGVRGGAEHAFLYDAATNAEVDLHPTGFQFSTATGVSGNFQTGWATDAADVPHAMLWNGTAASAIDLHPAGFQQSRAVGISSDSQVGVASLAPPNPGHAMLWRGTAASAVDLHPAGYHSSFAQAVAGTVQMGSGTFAGDSDFPAHALRWEGTAASVVDLHPASGYAFSVAMGAAEGVQAGFGGVAGVGDHALLWRDTAASVVDLHPAGMRQSRALATSGDVQVGFGIVDVGPSQERAVAWAGTAAGAVDLHSFLDSLDFSRHFPGETITIIHSRAAAVDARGVIVGNLELRSDVAGSRRIGVRWAPVPEPDAALLALLGIGSAAMMSRALHAGSSAAWWNGRH